MNAHLLTFSDATIDIDIFNNHIIVINRLIFNNRQRSGCNQFFLMLIISMAVAKSVKIVGSYFDNFARVLI